MSVCDICINRSKEISTLRRDQMNSVLNAEFFDTNRNRILMVKKLRQLQHYNQ